MFTNTDDIEIIDYQIAGLKKVNKGNIYEQTCYTLDTKGLENSNQENTKLFLVPLRDEVVLFTPFFSGHY